MRGKVQTVSLLDGSTATGAGESHQPWGAHKTVQVKGTTSSSTGSATMQLQGSNDGSNWTDLQEFIIALATTEGAGEQGYYSSDEPWKYVRGYVSAISGTGASVDMIMGNVPGF